MPSTFGAIAASLLLFLGVAGPIVAVSQIKARVDAETAATKEAKARNENDRLLYVAEMKVAHQAWQSANVGQVAALLKRHLPRGQKDLRGFEWFYLWQLWRDSQAKRALPHDGPGRLVYSPDGKTLAATGRRLRFWRTADASELLTVDAHDNLVKGVAFSPIGQMLATGGWDGALKLWRWDGKNLNQLITLREADEKMVYHDLAISPDEKLLATNGRESEVPLWDVENRRPLEPLIGHDSTVMCVAFSKDGVLATGGKGNAVILWDVKSDAPSQRRHNLPHGGAVDAVKFSPDGATLASGTQDNLIRLWGGETPELKEPLSGHTNAITGLSFSADGNTLASSSWDGTVKIWDLRANELLTTLRGHSGLVNDVTFSPDGKTLASVGQDEEIKLWDWRSRTRRVLVEGQSVEFSLRGDALTSRTKKGVLQMWDLAGQPKMKWTAPESGYVARSSDGKSLALGYSDGKVEVQDLDTKRRLMREELHNGPVRYMVFSPRGKTLASVGGRVLRLWDVATLKLLAEMDANRYTRVVFSPDGKTFATYSEDKAATTYSVRLWDLTARGSEVGLRELKTLAQQDTPFFSLAFSANNGAMLAAGDFRGEIKIWNVSTEQPPRTIRAHTSQVYALAFSPDHTRLASSGKDRSVKLWDVTTLDEVLTLKGHQRSVFSVAFSPNGRILASASEDNVVKLWHTATEAQVQAAGW